MAVYVDDMRAPYRRMIMCHMMADTISELLDMATKIGIDHRWFQGKGLYPHFDICLSKKKLAIEAGAVELDRQQMVEKMREILEKRRSDQGKEVTT